MFVPVSRVPRFRVNWVQSGVLLLFELAGVFLGEAFVGFLGCLTLEIGDSKWNFLALELLLVFELRQGLVLLVLGPKVARRHLLPIS